MVGHSIMRLTTTYNNTYERHLQVTIRQGSIVKKSPWPCEQSHTVILSAAKDLSVRRARPFAEFTLSATNGLRVTGRYFSVDEELLNSFEPCLRNKS
jgi:hypothetical protein